MAIVDKAKYPGVDESVADAKSVKLEVFLMLLESMSLGIQKQE